MMSSGSYGHKLEVPLLPESSTVLLYLGDGRKTAYLQMFSSGDFLYSGHPCAKLKVSVPREGGENGCWEMTVPLPPLESWNLGI